MSNFWGAVQKKALQKQQGLKLGLKIRHKAKQGERPTLRQNAF